MVWQPDVWAEALRCTEHTSFRLCRTMDECVRVCAQQPGWRRWAYDLGRAPSSSNHPKGFIAAPAETFVAAYVRVPPEHRHAYEVIDGPCDLFLEPSSARASTGGTAACSQRRWRRLRARWWRSWRPSSG